LCEKISFSLSLLKSLLTVIIGVTVECDLLP